MSAPWTRWTIQPSLTIRPVSRAWVREKARVRALNAPMSGAIAGSSAFSTAQSSAFCLAKRRFLASQ
ncbi:hypothetical protein D3C86_988210 [compost metagenome]